MPPQKPRALRSWTSRSPPISCNPSGWPPRIWEPEILAVLQDLPIGEASAPVQFGGLWYLFEVNELTRQPVSPDEYADAASSIETVIYNRKALESATRFVATLMTPLNVSTKREGFYVLADVLWAWYAHVTPQRNLLHYIEREAIDPHIHACVGSWLRSAAGVVR